MKWFRWTAVALGLLLPQLAAAYQPASAPPAPNAATTPNETVVVETTEVVVNPPAPTPTFNPGSIAWLLVSSAFVLMMSIPGLALFYGGLVRSKNVLATMMQTMAMVAVVTVQWFVVGYSISFHEGAGWGGLDWIFLRDVTADQPDPYGYAAEIPHQLWMVYQLMFAIITPALITGAFAERMKFSSMLVFMALWSTLVYDPLAHWVWGAGGWLRNGDPAAKIPALDFAGGTVVHISSGVTALVCALMIGRRRGYPTEPMMPHNLVLSFVGAGVLWVGWFGFNAGSALSVSPLAVTAFVSTHFAAASATLAWLASEWFVRGKPSALGAISGAVAGLVAVTPACGFVTPGSALLIGLIAGAVCFFSCTTVKNAFGYDDSLDAFGVHGVGGTVGAILTGVFATTAVNAAGQNGLLEGNATQLVNQVIAAGVTIVYAVVVSVILLLVINATMGLRVSEQEEISGLDLSQHGEGAYHP